MADDPPGQPYRPISDYGLIGNTFTAALVAPDGSIDWCCLPNFDSGAVFCRLLDARRGGSFRLGPAGRARSWRHYLEDSAALVTEFETEEGRVRLTDCMPVPPLEQAGRPGHADGYRILLRRLEGLAGEMEIELRFRPTPDFARQPAQLHITPEGCTVTVPQQALRLSIDPPLPLEASDGEARARFRLRAGQLLWVVLTHQENGSAAEPQAPDALLEGTLRHWRDWNARCDYHGPFEKALRSSARALKLLTFAPSGAIVAAPTTSLPERIGGERNWDYRFCWLRDSAMVLHALLSIGHFYAADHFFSWLANVWRPHQRLQIIYRLDGGELLPEVELAHLEGYRGSRPVRVGNAAADQVQLDVYGHLLDAASVYLGGRDAHPQDGFQRVLADLADEAARRWPEADQGIWEVRSPPAHHVSSKLMCWVALDRALKLVEMGKLSGDAARWQRERDAVREAICTHGYHDGLGAFTQCFGDDCMDASALLMPIVGFLDANEPRVRSTAERVCERLMRNGLVSRYDCGDGVAGDEGAFLICTSWMVDNLALQGRLPQARELLSHLLSFANDLGLMSEEIDPDSGRMLGNFPQGYTHLAVIHSVLTIARAEPSRP